MPPERHFVHPDLYSAHYFICRVLKAGGILVQRRFIRQIIRNAAGAWAPNVSRLAIVGLYSGINVVYVKDAGGGKWFQEVVTATQDGGCAAGNSE